MKKVLLLTLVFIAAVTLMFAGTPRAYLQKCTLDTGMEADVTNTGNTTNPNYIVTADILETPGEMVTTQNPAPDGYIYKDATQIRINRSGTNPNFYTATFLQLGTFPTQWAAGQTVVMTVTHIPTGQMATWNLTIPAGTTVINIQNPAQIIPPASVPADDYQLTVTSNVPGMIATGAAAAIGQATPWTSAVVEDVNNLVGVYSMAPVAGGTWAPASIEVVAGDFTAKANLTHSINFVWTADPDTYNYTLYVAGPAGTVVATPMMTNDVIPFNWSAANPNMLAGMYTADPAPAGFHWVVNPIEVTTDGWELVTKKGAAQGSRSAGTKAHFEYQKTITFVLEADPIVYWDVVVTSDPAGAAIYVDGLDSGEVTPFTFQQMEGTNALYSVMMAGYTWAPVDYAVNNIMADDAIEFVGTPVIEDVIIDGVTPPPAGFVVTPGAPPLNNGSDIWEPWQGWTITGTGIRNVVVENPYPTVQWWSWIQVGGVWIEAPNPLNTATYTYLNVDFDAKGPVYVIVNDNATLPVELSGFYAVLTAQNFVKLTWISQSETGLLGYRVYRSENNNQAEALSITPVMVPATNTSTTQTYSVTDAEVEIGQTYWYWLESVDFGSSQFHGPVSVLVEGNVPPVLPEVTSMRNAYPNPFKANANTNIEVAVKAGEAGTVTIYNILGQAVKTFKVTEGFHKLNWNGKDTKGNACGSGIYFYKLSTPSMKIGRAHV